MLGYERKVKAHWIRVWLLSHPRIVIPAVFALLAATTVAIFDPLVSLVLAKAQSNQVIVFVRFLSKPT